MCIHSAMQIIKLPVSKICLIILFLNFYIQIREKAIGQSPDSDNVLTGLRSKTSDQNQNKTNAASLICYRKLSKQSQTINLSFLCDFPMRLDSIQLNFSLHNIVKIQVKKFDPMAHFENSIQWCILQIQSTSIFPKIRSSGAL